MPGESTEPLTQMPEDTGQVETPDQTKIEGDSTLLRLPVELLLSIADLLDEIQTPCLALSCTYLWALLKPKMAKDKSGYRHLKELLGIQREVSRIILRDLPGYRTCFQCYKIYQPSKSELRSILPEGMRVDSDRTCDRCGKGMVNRALEFQINWDQKYKMLHHIKFSDVQLALQQFAEQKIDYLVRSLSHTQVACLEVESLDPDEGLHTDRHTMLTSIEPMIVKQNPHVLPMLYLRIQHILTTQARNRDDTIMDWKELPHSCFHGDTRELVNRLTRASREIGLRFRNRSFHCHNQCYTCQTDFHIDAVNDRDTGTGFTMVLTRWVNLGPGLSDEDLEWRVHSQCEQYVKAPYWRPPEIF